MKCSLHFQLIKVFCYEDRASGAQLPKSLFGLVQEDLCRSAFALISCFALFRGVASRLERLVAGTHVRQAQLGGGDLMPDSIDNSLAGVLA